MKIFLKKDDWSIYKVNFADSKNVFVGYDFYQCCCESYGWFISDEINGSCRSDDFEKLNEELRDYIFDKDYHEIISGSDHDDYYDNLIAVFKLVNGDKIKYLHLWNKHNGYYSHGFHMDDDGVTIHSGRL